MSMHHAGPVTGADNELIDRLLSLIDQAPAYEPMWWMNYGALAAVNVACNVPRPGGDAGRVQFVSDLRDRIEHLVDRGAAEDFLVRALRREIDDFAGKRADVGERNQQAERVRDHLKEVIENSGAREAWRDRMARRIPAFAEMPDDRLIAEAQRMLEGSPLTAPATAEDAASAWASSEAWLDASKEVLGDHVIERWRHLSIQRQMDT
ncbi:hypothetical protein DQ237_11420 [Blastococcus sp. TF02-8]|uniref:hypothetical protein n=1 Tax=Blastococcus sp. TF02-8 TaxID=2250574 RepID=UPI000DE9292A|nr:hypothetical protein [Blastococcus sp. TF02-8]RBY95762.1 hypothetical protein DQ237_11420 [Blastococcus sp. TF02-8]